MKIENARKIIGNSTTMTAVEALAFTEAIEQLAEAQRLLKLAVEDMKNVNLCSEVCCRDSFACRVSDTCDFKWRYADEVEKFLS